MSSPPPCLSFSSTAGRWVVAVTVLGSAIAAIDSTVVGIALPAIGRNFAMSVSSLQWVVSAYLLALAGLLLVGGALGDRFGRRRIFITGVVCFALTSLVCAVAPDAAVLIAGRALQGVGAALLTPGSLAILRASFVPDDQGRAVGAWSGLGGVAIAVGPFVGGFLISAVSWRLIFLINLPIAAVVVVMASRHVPETTDPTAGGRVDVVGAALVSAGLVGVTAGIIDAPSHGWGSPPVEGALLGGALALVAFVLVEGRTPRPVLPLSLFRSIQFSATNVVTFLVYGALGGALFLLPVELEEVAHYSPLEAGTSLLPLTAIMLVFSSRSGALATRIGPRLQMAVGPLVVGAGMVLFRLAGSSGGYLTAVLPAIVVLGAGLALTVAPLTTTALASAPADHAGVASAVNNDVARAGGLVAVALLPVVSGITGASYLHPVQLSAGFRTAVAVAGAAAAGGGVLAGVLVRNPRRPAAPAAPVPPTTAHCGLEAPPLAAAAAGTTPAPRGARMGS
ncbi:MAG TPA: DHA2 family efflux MFS transporter permease subunit [Acidimicrobiales bacterium]|nr:DHA2 family efflux MFS transporter permease subunit [Acidimicrobiales bacterium]